MRRLLLQCMFGLAILLFAACGKDGPLFLCGNGVKEAPLFCGVLDAGDHLIFGIYHGECAGDCMRLFKLEDGQLFADDCDWCFSEPIPFMEDPLEQDKYDLAEQLIAAFPDALLASDKRTYGCPDCADQGGYYLELQDKNETTVWHIDTRNDDQSQEILDYKALVEQVLNELL